MIITRPKRAILMLAGLLSCIAPMAIVPSADAAEQCRFISAKPEREACYARQEADLAAKRNKPESRLELKRDPTMEALQQMKQDDQALDRQIHGICRGC